MRILSLDHGTRRIGVAVSDEMKIIATPLEAPVDCAASLVVDSASGACKRSFARRRWNSS